MKLIELEKIFHSEVCNVQNVIIWDAINFIDIEKCTIERAYCKYADRELVKMYQTFDGEIVLSIM